MHAERVPTYFLVPEQFSPRTAEPSSGNNPRGYNRHCCCLLLIRLRTIHNSEWCAIFVLDADGNATDISRQTVAALGVKLQRIGL